MPWQLWVSVAQIGCFYGLIALGYYLVLEGADFFNFALGALAVDSGLASSWFVTRQGWPLPLAVAVGVLSAVLLAVVTEVVVIRPVESRSNGGELSALVSVVAILFVVQQLGGTLFGKKLLSGKKWVAGPDVSLGGVDVSRQTIVLVGVTVAVFAAMWTWIRRTRYGRMLRAVGSNRDAARTLGMPVLKVRVVAFALAGFSVGIAGPLFSPHAGVSFQFALTWALYGFLALVIGGTGSIWAPLAGGVALGIIQVIVPYVFGSDVLDYAILVIALAFFALRPGGLFTRRVRT
jgi:branched-chain amino acid transport system permease protein